MKPQNKKVFLTITLGLMVLILSAAAAAYFKYYKPMQTITPEMKQAERAIYSPASLGLASLNLVQLNLLEKNWIGLPDNTEYVKFKKKKETWEKRFSDAGIDPRQDLQYLIGALDGGDDGLISSVILVGKFKSAQVKEALKKRIQLKEENENGFTFLSYQEINKVTCKPENPRAFWISDQFIIWSTPKNLQSILGRLSKKNTAEVDKSKWENYRNNKIFSAMLTVPKVQPKTSGMMEAIGSQAMAKNLNGFERAYLGINIEWLKFAGVLNLRTDFNNKEQVAITLQEWQKSLKDTKSNWRKDLPSLSKLLNKISFKSEQQSFNMNVDIDQDAFLLVKELPKEFMAHLFSGFGASLAITDKGNFADVIDEQPFKLKMETSLSVLPKFDPKGTFFEKPLQHEAGPMGFSIKSARFDRQNSKEQEIEIEYIGVGVPNIEVGELVSLYFNEANDSKGKNLIKLKSNCSVDAVEPSHPLFFSEHNNLPSFKGNHTLKLQEGVQVNEVATIKGEAKIKVPTKVETKEIKAQIDQKIETPNFALVIKKVSKSSVSMNIYGDDTFIIAIDGLNKDGKKLQTAGGGSMGFIYGEGKSKHLDFRGGVVKLRVYLASEAKDFTVPFELKPKEDIVDEFSSQQSFEKIPTTKIFEEISKEEFVKKFSKNDVANVSKDRWIPLNPSIEGYIEEKSKWIKSERTEISQRTLRTGPFTLYWEAGKKDSYPLFEIFSNELTNSRGTDSLEVKLLQIETKEGKILNPPAELSKNQFYNPWIEKDEMRLGDFQSDPRTQEFLKFIGPPRRFSYSRLPDSLKSQDIKKVKGLIRFKLIPKIQTRIIENPKLGSALLEGEQEVLKLIEITDGQFSYAYNNKWGQVLGVQNFDEANREIERRKTTTQQGRISFYRQKGVVKTEFFFAEKEEFVEYPFEIEF